MFFYLPVFIFKSKYTIFFKIGYYTNVYICLYYIIRYMNYINYMNIGTTENYVSYNDTDSMTDYNNGRICNMKKTIELLQKDGGKTINVHTDGSQEDTMKYMNRIAKIAKATGYKNNVKIHQRFNQMDNVRTEWVEVSGQLVRGA